MCSSGGCDDKRLSISRSFSVHGRSGIFSTPASSCLDSNRSSSAVEGTFASELIKVAPKITGSVSQVRRVCDSADTASGTDPLRPGDGFCSAAAHAAAGAGEENSKNEVPECRPRRRVVGEENSKNAVSECRQRRLVTGDPPGLVLHATADESEGKIGLREVIVSGSSFSMPINSSNSSMDVACVGPASAVVALSATASSSSCPLASCVAGAVHARRTVTSMHALTAHNSWSDTGRVQGPTGRRCTKGGVSVPAEDLRLRGGGRGKFSAGRPGAGAGCRFTSQEATRHWNQASQGGCGHTFPPPGGS